MIEYINIHGRNKFILNQLLITNQIYLIIIIYYTKLNLKLKSNQLNERI